MSTEKTDIIDVVASGGSELLVVATGKFLVAGKFLGTWVFCRCVSVL